MLWDVAQDKLFYNSQCLDACPVRTYASRNGSQSARFGENPRRFYSKFLWTLWKLTWFRCLCALVVVISCYFFLLLLLLLLHLFFSGVYVCQFLRMLFIWVFFEIQWPSFWLDFFVVRCVLFFVFQDKDKNHGSRTLGSECIYYYWYRYTCSSILQVHSSNGQCL